MHGLFVTATGTDCGKTWFSRGLVRALRVRGLSVAALKPLETGVGPDGPRDALALARAAGNAHLAHDDAFVRLGPPTSPFAAATASGLLPPSVDALADALRRRAAGHDVTLVEGAGGLLVPLDANATIAELAASLGLPTVLVARDALGTLSHVLTAIESAERRGLEVRAVVLTRGPWSRGDVSVETNAEILRRRVSAPVLVMPSGQDDDDALAALVDPWIERLLPQR
ncbi:MAG: dethiobiotin synthase [Deltaproteobacteria bacterium]|nr:dethiobiotin synthase [Deltaproteobacteria bacterium]